MKKIFVFILGLMMMVGTFATPRLEGNKIYLDEAATSLFTAEQFIENIGGEEALDILDNAGYTKRMQLELFTNPNKVIEFATEETAKLYYEEVLSFGDEPIYCAATDHYEDIDFILFIELFQANQYEYEMRDGKRVITGWNEKNTPTYCFIGE